MASTQHQQREERPLPRAPDRNIVAILNHLQWPEDPEFPRADFTAAQTSKLLVGRMSARRQKPAAL